MSEGSSIMVAPSPTPCVVLEWNPYVRSQILFRSNNGFKYGKQESWRPIVIVSTIFNLDTIYEESNRLVIVSSPVRCLRIVRVVAFCDFAISFSVIVTTAFWNHTCRRLIGLHVSRAVHLIVSFSRIKPSLYRGRCLSHIAPLVNYTLYSGASIFTYFRELMNPSCFPITRISGQCCSSIEPKSTPKMPFPRSWPLTWEHRTFSPTLPETCAGRNTSSHRYHERCRIIVRLTISGQNPSTYPTNRTYTHT